MDKDLITILSDQRRELLEAITHSEERTALLMKSELGKINIRLEGIETHLAKVNGSVASHETNLRAIDKAIDWINVKLRGIATKQDKEALTWQKVGRWLWVNWVRLFVIGIILFIFVHWLAGSDNWKVFFEMLKLMR